MKFDFNKPLLGLDNEPVKDGDKPVMLNKILGSNIVGEGRENVMKIFGWGLEIYQKGSVELDEVDQDIVKKIIEGCATINILVKGRLLEIFKDTKK